MNRRFRIMATLIDKTCITNKNLYSILIKDSEYSLYMVLGIINSKLLSYLYVNQITQASKDDFPQITITDINKLPFPNMGEPEKKALSTKLISNVKTLLAHNEKMESAKSDFDKTSIARKIESAEQQLDGMVYELYGLTKEEIEIVESA